MTDLSIMRLDKSKYINEFCQQYFKLVIRLKLTNDFMTKVTYLSKISNNIGDLVRKYYDEKDTSLNKVYWIDLLQKCYEKLKYLCWMKNAQESTSPSLECCIEVIPWTPLNSKKKKKNK
jgi:hypothetical protein